MKAKTAPLAAKDDRASMKAAGTPRSIPSELEIIATTNERIAALIQTLVSINASYTAKKIHVAASPKILLQ